MVVAALYRGRAATEGADASWRVRLGLAAVCFGLCSQVLYCLMLAALIHGWVALYSGNSFNHLQLSLSNLGVLLSITALVAALFSRGLPGLASLGCGYERVPLEPVGLGCGAAFNVEQMMGKAAGLAFRISKGS